MGTLMIGEVEVVLQRREQFEAGGEVAGIDQLVFERAPQPFDEHVVERAAAAMAYTFSNALDDSSNFNDYMNFSNYRLSRGLSNFDVTHNFVASYNWEIPFNR